MPVEKLVYLLMGPAGGADADLVQTLRGPAAEEVRRLGAYRVQINVADAALGEPFGVEPDEDADQIVAVVSMWVDASEQSRAHTALPRGDDGELKWDGYLVCESEPLRPDPSRHTPGSDGRIPGFA